MTQLAWFGLAILGVSLLGVADDIIRHGIPLLLVLCLLPVVFWLGRRSRGQNLILASRIRYRRARHYRSIPWSPLSEDQLFATVTDYATWLHLTWFHDYDPKRNRPGFPDLVIAGPGGHLFAELKTEYGDLSPDQVTWKYVLLGGGATWRLWRPSDWTSNRITNELRSLTQPKEIAWTSSCT
jgi:hypothetical protein